MNGSKIVAGSAKPGYSRTIKVAPVTRAVRAALAISVTAAFLTGGGVAYAGTCTPSSGSTVFCDGSFTDTISIPNVVDLTLVVGSNSPSSVTPAPSHNGIMAIQAGGVHDTGNVSVLNYADITTIDGAGIYVYGSTSAHVSNRGDISTTSVFADGIVAVAQAGGVDIYNAGAISVASSFQAVGIAAGTAQGGNIQITNTGDIGSGSATTHYGVGIAAGISSIYGSGGNIVISNDAGITAEGIDGAKGIAASSHGGDATVINDGDIQADALGLYGSAIGVFASAENNASVSNSGDISVISVSAKGVDAQSNAGSASVYNSGSITASAGAFAPPAPLASDVNASAFPTPPPGAITIDAIAYGNVTVINSGYTGAFGTGVFDVTAVLAESTGIGYTATVDNLSSGAIFAFTDGSGTALGIEAYAANGNVDVSNDGLLVAVSYYGIADGAFAAGQLVNVSSSYQIYAIGSSWGAGIEAEGSDMTTVSNSGLIYSVAAGAYGHAFGVYAVGGAGGTTVYNSGNVDVRGPYATGIQAQGNGGDVSVFNAYGGNLTVGNSFTSYYATGISAATNYDSSNISVSNAGGITALSAYGSSGILAVATGVGSTVSVNNAGDVYVSTASKYGTSIGLGASGDGNTSISNGGTITVTDGGTSYGALALSFNGNASVNNYGKVDVHAANYVGSGFGLVASSANGSANVYNSGTVQVTAGYSAIGIQAGSLTGTSIRNTGAVTVDAFKYGYGMVATAGRGDASIYNGGRASVGVHSAYGSALGLVGVSTQGNVSISNNGSVSTDAFYQAIGVFARADDGNVSIGNTGYISATSYLDSAIGTLAIASNGDVSVFASDTGNILAYSAGNTAIGIETIADDGRAAVYNYSAIGATAGQSPYAMYYSGALGVADGIFAAAQTVVVRNGGAINATGYGWAAGIEAQSSDSANVSNNGAITATSTGRYSHAFGMYTTSDSVGLRDYNSGTLNVQGSYAIGIEARASNGYINIGNSGDIIAGNTGRTYYATGIDAATNYASNNIYINNSGSVVALSYFGSTGIAVVATGAGSTTFVRNLGDVYVTTAGKYGTSMGIVASSDSDARVGNAGSVIVSYGGNSYGISALSFNGNAIAYNSGDIDVTGGLVIGSGSGIVASSVNQSAFANNTGTISVAAGYYGFGIQASGLTGSFASNYGSVGVQTKYGYGYGILATSGQGYATARNVGTGSVDVRSIYGTALGLASVATLGYASVYNSGSVAAVGYVGAIGAIGIANAGSATVISNGDLSATTFYGSATGILAHGYGTTIAYNGGDLQAISRASDATGIEAVSDRGMVLVNNSGAVAATGYNGATGVEALGSDLVSVSNSGTITATTAGNYSGTYGVLMVSGGDAHFGNTGSITATTDGYGGNTIGVFVQASGDLTAYSTGSIRASAYSSATGLLAYANGGNVVVSNSGLVHVDSFGIDETAGIHAIAAGSGDNAAVFNSGSVYTYAFKYGPSVGIAVEANGDATIYNSGLVAASAWHSYGIHLSGQALGLVAVSANGSATVTNIGTVTADADAATGIEADGLAAANVNNQGTVLVDTGLAYGPGTGIVASSSQGDVTISNGSTGVVDVTSFQNVALGLVGIATLGDVTIVNAGSVSANSTIGSVAIGIQADAYQLASVFSSGDIYATSQMDARGILANGTAGVSVDNAGAISVDAGTQGFGIFAISNQGDVSISNYGAGSVDVLTHAGTAVGLVGISVLGDASINNAGSVTATGGYGGATRVIGAYAQAVTGYASISNSGDITANGYALAMGIDVQGGVSVVNNSGTVTASTSRAYSGTYGILAHGGGDVTVGNTGSIYAQSSGSNVTGVWASSYGAVTVNNGGDISAAADGSNSHVIGVIAQANAPSSADTVSITNSGSIQADSTGTGPGAISLGVLAMSTGVMSIGNQGAITAYSQYGTAVGIQGRSYNNAIYAVNSGTVVASAGGFDAMGIQLTGDSYASITNALGASIAASTNWGDAYGIQISSHYGVASIHNDGSVAAISQGNTARAVVVTAGVGAVVANSGSISAEADGIEPAFGLIAASNGNVTIQNSGSITATNGYNATAIFMVSGTASTLVNTGTIEAISTSSSLEGNVAVEGGSFGSGYGAVENILNYGYLHGAIQTFGGQDLLFNGSNGLWLVDNHSTDFGDGDDIIGNAAGGTIQLSDGAIHLGDGNDTINNGGLIQLTDSAIYFEGGTGNSFNNNGVIHVLGDSLIDMGSGGTPPSDAFAPAAVPSLNTTPLVNNGVISFLDGAPDDVLTIVGDLGGTGAINIDVSVLNGTSDMLYVDGSIANGGVQTVNVALDQLPTTAITNIPFAQVTGNSVDGSFVFGGFAAGNVVNIGPSNFLDLQLGVVSQIDPTNAANDVFSIGLDVAGLNDTGTLAANVASGVQSLVNSQIGTWRQRMGVLPAKGEHAAGLSPWFRSFTDKGEVDPAHVNANFAQGGNFRYDQSNSGQEVGMNVNPGDRGFNFGLLLSKSEGSQHLVNPGVGTDRINSDAVGIYGTWISPNGWYVDLSHRWVSFDAVLRSAGGEQETKGDASAWNVEAGYDAWTLSGGMKITPQVQYTRTRVGDIRDVHGDSATFAANGGDSSRARLGVALSKSINSDSGITWTPYGSVNAVREFDGETSYAINNVFFGSTSTEGTSAMVELGLGAQKGGFSITGGVNWTDGGAVKSFTGGQLELRYSW